MIVGAWYAVPGIAAIHGQVYLHMQRRFSREQRVFAYPTRCVAQESHSNLGILGDCTLVDSTWEDECRWNVIRYLKNAPTVAVFRGQSYCRFGCGSNGSCKQSDGSWTWPEGLAHYVERHDVKLPEAFVAHMKKRDYEVPKFVDAPQNTDSTAWWRNWCRQQVKSTTEA